MRSCYKGAAYGVIKLNAKLLRALDEEADVGQHVAVNLCLVGGNLSGCEALELSDFHLRRV